MSRHTFFKQISINIYGALNRGKFMNIVSPALNAPASPPVLKSRFWVSTFSAFTLADYFGLHGSGI